MDWKTATLACQVLVALPLAGCGGTPLIQTYSLPPVSTSRVLAHPPFPLPGVLTVHRLGADDLLNSRRMAWRSSPAALTVGHYSEQLWNLSPPEQMQVQIERCLAGAQTAESVVPDSVPVQADWILSGRLRYFEQQLTGPAGSPNNAQARVGAELILTRMGDRRQTAWQGTIDSAAALPNANPVHIAEGTHRALEEFCAGLLRKLTAADIARGRP